MLKTCLTILMLSIYTLLIGCGTTGPLYIPEQRYPLPQERVETIPAPTPDNQPTKE